MDKSYLPTGHDVDSSYLYLVDRVLSFSSAWRMSSLYLASIEAVHIPLTTRTRLSCLFLFQGGGFAVGCGCSGGRVGALEASLEDGSTGGGDSGGAGGGIRAGASGETAEK
jgi:hypothetical protein